MGFSKLNLRTHGAFCSYIQDPRIRLKGIQMPRGFYKTSICTISDSLRLVLKDPDNTRILISHAVATKARKMLFEVQWHVMNNKLLRWLYPEAMPDPKKVRFNVDQIDMNTGRGTGEATMEAIGVTGASVGSHFTHHKKDDWVNEDQLASKDLMEKLIDIFTRSSALFVSQKERVDHVVGNRWAMYDLQSHVMQDSEYVNFVMAAEDEHGKSTFPSEFPKSRLDKIKEDWGTYHYSAQYLNNPLNPENTMFQPDQINEYEWLPADALMKMAITIDPAQTDEEEAKKRDPDPTGIVAAAMDEFGNLFELDYVNACLAPISDTKPSVVGEVYRLAQKWGIRSVGVEGGSGQKLWKTIFEQEKKRRKQEGEFHDIVLYMLQPHRKKSKYMRIEKLTGPASMGKLWVRSKHHEVRGQLLSYPFCKHEDILDALAYQLEMLRAPQRGWKELQKNPYQVETILAELRERTSSAEEDYLFLNLPEAFREPGEIYDIGGTSQ
jgi:hypothetical protein